jgi:diguanylate cyclase (GGDEF)-like protein
MVLIAVVLAALIGGTFTAVKLTTEHLLHENATRAAQQWARYVAENVDDLEQIAAGQQPSTASVAFFQWSLRIGSVFRYEIFNRQGYSQLLSDQHRIAMVDVSEFRPEAAKAAKTQTMFAAVKEGDQPDLPAFFGEAYVPVIVNGTPIAVVAAYVDQTDERSRFLNSFLLGAVGLCALTSLAFVIPAAAWYRRTVEKERAYAEIRFLGKHDAMTRLANRTHLAERMTEVLDRATRTGEQIAVHCLDLDHFRGIKDRHGRLAGDAVIKQAGDRIRGATQVEDIVARMDGDEFVIVQLGISGKPDAERLAARLLDAMSRPFMVGSRAVAATASIGVALAPGDGRDAERLVRVADLALHKSKAAGRNCWHFFTPEMDAELQARLALEARIREAAQDELFELYLQPLVNIADGKTTGYEALLRLRTADDTPIPPSAFIPVAEQIGLIQKIGAWVVHRACLTAAQWPGNLTVAVNLSPAQFDGSLRDVVHAALDVAHLDPARLELEITESLLMEDTEAVMTELAQLKALGVAIVMDDFGTGYSSLSYLWRFPFSKIKIDRSFIQNLNGADKSIKTIVRTIINLGHTLDMRVTVEGVEDIHQLDIVRELGCDEVQGFYFSRPVPASEITKNLIAEVQQKLRKASPELRRTLKLVS